MGPAAVELRLDPEALSQEDAYKGPGASTRLRGSNHEGRPHHRHKATPLRAPSGLALHRPIPSCKSLVRRVRGPLHVGLPSPEPTVQTSHAVAARSQAEYYGEGSQHDPTPQSFNAESHQAGDHFSISCRSCLGECFSLCLRSTPPSCTITFAIPSTGRTSCHRSPLHSVSRRDRKCPYPLEAGGIDGTAWRT